MSVQFNIPQISLHSISYAFLYKDTPIEILKSLITSGGFQECFYRNSEHAEIVWNYIISYSHYGVNIYFNTSVYRILDQKIYSPNYNILSGMI